MAIVMNLIMLGEIRISYRLARAASFNISRI